MCPHNPKTKQSTAIIRSLSGISGVYGVAMIPGNNLVGEKVSYYNVMKCMKVLCFKPFDAQHHVSYRC